MHRAERIAAMYGMTGDADTTSGALAALPQQQALSAPMLRMQAAAGDVSATAPDGSAERASCQADGTANQSAEGPIAGTTIANAAAQGSTPSSKRQRQSTLGSTLESPAKHQRASNGNTDTASSAAPAAPPRPLHPHVPSRSAMTMLQRPRQQAAVDATGAAQQQPAPGLVADDATGADEPQAPPQAAGGAAQQGSGQQGTGDAARQQVVLQAVDGYQWDEGALQGLQNLDIGALVAAVPWVDQSVKRAHTRVMSCLFEDLHRHALVLQFAACRALQQLFRCLSKRQHPVVYSSGWF